MGPPADPLNGRPKNNNSFFFWILSNLVSFFRQNAVLCVYVMSEVKVKVKFTLEQTTKVQRGEVQHYFSFNLGTRCGVGGQGHAPAVLLTVKIRY